MSPPMSVAALHGATRALSVLLNHTYTRTPQTDGPVNNHQEATSVPGTPVSGVACLYSTKDVTVLQGGTVVTVSTPILRVLPTDPLAVDDQVSNILDRAGGLLLAGPLTVETIDEGAELGVSILRTATLRGSDIQRGG